MALFGSTNGFDKKLRREFPPVDRDQLTGGCETRFERRAVPDYFSHVASFSCRDNQAKRETQVDRLGHIVDRFLKSGLLLAIHQFPAASRQAVERRGRPVSVEPISQKSFPIIW